MSRALNRESAVSMPLISALTTELPLHAQPGQIISLIGRDEKDYRICCDYPPGSSHKAVVDVLKRKMQLAKQADLRGRGTTSLAGDGLRWTPGAASLLDADDLDDDQVPGEEVCANLSYRLVLCSARAVVGYCTFDINIGHISTSRVGPSFEIEMGDAWIQPRARKIGLGGSLAYAVAFLAVQSLWDLETRMAQSNAYTGRATPIFLDVVADVYSTSGEGLLFCVGDHLASALKDFRHEYKKEFRALRLGRVEVDARW